jgi:MFS family permease
MTSETWKRLAVLAALFALSLVLYIDRAAISSAKTSMAAALSLSETAMGAVFSAFALGYAVAQIPSGWLADRIGPRLALTIFVTLWSAFTVLTGAASGLGSLLVVRFLFGAAEAGAFPGSARVIYNWLPPGMHGGFRLLQAKLFFRRHQCDRFANAPLARFRSFSRMNPNDEVTSVGGCQLPKEPPRFGICLQRFGDVNR